jgi:hypothetical protein
MRAALRTVATMAREGKDGHPRVPFEHIEAFIEYSRYSDEEKALLWLYAWCGGRATQIKELIETNAHQPTN